MLRLLQAVPLDDGHTLWGHPLDRNNLPATRAERAITTGNRKRSPDSSAERGSGPRQGSLIGNAPP